MPFELVSALRDVEWEPVTALATIASVFVAAASIKASMRSTKEAMDASAKASQESIKNTNLSNRVLKTVDVAMHCANRYEELSALRAEIIRLEAQEAGEELIKNPTDQELAGRLTRRKTLDDLSDHYFRRFWALKSDQFDYWLYGVLDHDTFYDWSYYLVVKIIEDRTRPKPSARYNLAESWERWSETESRPGHGGSNPMFVRFTNGLFDFAEKWRPYDGYLPEQVLNLMKGLEGTPAEPGFSKRYRADVWNGMEFEQFQSAMKRDFEIRKRQVASTAADEA
jgi:hypothetical protein